MARITALDVRDVRFPTSRELDGSDAVNVDPDYSAAYVTLRTDDGPEGYGLVFTCGRGTEVVVACVEALAPHVVGRDVDGVTGDLGRLARALGDDSQLRWLGPAKGVLAMAVGGVVNAAWDLASRRAGKPLWQYVADLTPDELVAQVDFRYLADALTRDEALDLLRAREAGKAGRATALRAEGVPAYTTSPGWLGYDDAKLVRLCREAVADGFDLIKLKVGARPEDDVRRLRLAREVVGDGVRLAVDANQAWDVPTAIAWMRELAPFDPFWIEEPTSPDDVLGHAAIRRGIAPVRVATGEHGQNPVLFKQLLQAEAIDVLQLDATRVAGVNDNLAILLLAAKFGVPVCPHAGGVGLCELVQHLAMADLVAIGGERPDRVVEYVDHLHEHFTDPVVVRDARYLAPETPGFGARMHEASVERYAFPDGPEWRS